MTTHRTIQHLVDEQIRRAALRGAQTTRDDEHVVHWPVVTISREAGAGGTTLGRRIADRLGFACWDQELLARIAEESGAVESVLAAIDEQVRSSVAEFVTGLLVGVEYTQDEYRKALTRIVGSIAHQGAAVLVGRGGHVILGPERALRVRVVCPEGERVNRVMARDQLSEAAAHRRVRDVGAQAAAFMRLHFRTEIADPHCFDLLVNSGSLDVGQATELVVGAYQAKFGRLPEQLAPISRVRELGATTPVAAQG